MKTRNKINITIESNKKEEQLCNQTFSFDIINAHEDQEEVYSEGQYYEEIVNPLFHGFMISKLLFWILDKSINPEITASKDELWEYEYIIVMIKVNDMFSVNTQDWLHDVHMELLDLLEEEKEMTRFQFDNKINYQFIKQLFEKLNIEGDLGGLKDDNLLNGN